MANASINIQFPKSSDCAQSGPGDYILLNLPDNSSHVFWASVGFATQPSVGGSPTYHAVDVTGMNESQVADAFAQTIVNTGFWSITGYTQQTVPVINGVYPSIDNLNPQAGDTLTATHGSWTQSPSSYTYRWYANGVIIGGGDSKHLQYSGR